MSAIYATIMACCLGIGYCFGCYRMLAKQRDGKLILERDHDNTVEEIARNLRRAV